MTLFANKYRVESTRLHKFDYTRHGVYHVTIHIKNHDFPLANITGMEMQLTPEGRIVRDCWQDLPNHYNNISLDEYVIMPDHFHGVIRIVNRADGQKRHGLPEFVRALKSFSSRRINELHGKKIDIWQARYYDRHLKSDNELERVRQYIKNNPDKWIKNHHCSSS